MKQLNDLLKQGSPSEVETAITQSFLAFGQPHDQARYLELLKQLDTVLDLSSPRLEKAYEVLSKADFEPFINKGLAKLLALRTELSNAEEA